MCLETKSYTKLIDNFQYKSYAERLASFDKKWNGKLKPELLAAAGFYFLSFSDVCKCFYCGVEIFDWEYNDCPIEEHFTFQKNCDLIQCLYNTKDKKNVRQHFCKCNNCKEIKVCKCLNWQVLLALWLIIIFCAFNLFVLLL